MWFERGAGPTLHEMKAVQFSGSGSVKLIHRPRPTAHDDVVVVRMRYSGICGTDLELLLPSPAPVPIIAGHEVVGTVEEFDGTAEFSPGDRVMVNCHVTCGVCDFCRSGDVAFCADLKAIGFQLDGGNAEFLAVPKRNLIPIPPDISFEAALIVGDALGTPYHAVKRGGVESGDIVGVFGVGPLGLMAIVCLTHFGATVVAVDLNGSRLEAATKFGAAHTVNPEKEDPLAAIHAATGGHGLDKTFDCSGSSAAIQLAHEALRIRGRHVQVGASEEVAVKPFDHFISKEIEMIGSRNFNLNEVAEVLALVRNSPIIDELVTHRFPLDRAAEAFQVAAEGVGLKILLEP